MSGFFSGGRRGGGRVNFILELNLDYNNTQKGFFDLTAGVAQQIITFRNEISAG